jgi:ferrous iron transport protein A
MPDVSGWGCGLKTTGQPQILSSAGEGRAVRFTRVEAGRELTARLTSMGLVRGVVMHIIRNQGRACIVSIRGNRVVLGRGIVHKIWVEPVVAARGAA